MQKSEKVTKLRYDVDYYLLRLDWNLILRSRWPEYAMRKLQSPIRSDSKDLYTKTIS